MTDGHDDVDRVAVVAESIELIQVEARGDGRVDRRLARAIAARRPAWVRPSPALTASERRRTGSGSGPPPLPDDPHLHDAFRAYMSDITWTGTRPLDLDGDTRGIISLDHAMWFHRPARADQWLFFDAQSVVNTLGRGLLRGAVHGSDRSLNASMAQETLLIPHHRFAD